MSPLVLRRLVAALVLTGLFVGQAIFAVVAEPRLRPPPPTPVNGRPSPFPSVLHTPSDAVAAPQLDARAAVLADLDSGAVLFEKSPALRWPIASLTKLMTALVTLEHAELADVVVVSRDAVFEDDDYGAVSTVGLRAGERITVEDLLYALLLGSANDAADALAIHVSGDRARFISAMNRTARGLGMGSTRFFSTNGLDDRGRSTALDLLKLVRAADANPDIRDIVDARFHTIRSSRGRPRYIQNRNVLLWLYPGAFGTKTGFTAAADFCLIGAAERDGRRLVAIVVGDPDDPFSDAAALLDHGFEGYTQRTVIARGDDLGTVRIRGGTVPVVAGDDLEALVPTASLEELVTRIEVDPGARFPPARGEPVANAVVRVPGLTLGSVPLIVSSVPPAPAAEGPWWARTVLTVGRAVRDAVASLAS